MRLVVLMAVRSHLLAGACFGPYAVDERSYAASLWASVPDRSLVLIDRHYLQANVLVPLMSTGSERPWMTRAKSNTKFSVIRRLGGGDELKVEPTRISFVAALRYFVEQWLWAAQTMTPGAIPKRLSTMRDRLRRFLLPPRRPERVFPRAVKIKMSNYARKLPKSSSGNRAK